MLRDRIRELRLKKETRVERVHEAGYGGANDQRAKILRAVSLCLLRRFALGWHDEIHRRQDDGVPLSDRSSAFEISGIGNVGQDHIEGGASQRTLQIGVRCHHTDGVAGFPERRFEMRIAQRTS